MTEVPGAVPGATAHYDGADGPALAARLGVPSVHSYGTVASTMDLAHALAEAGAPAGTVVLADAQDAGRGRQGRGWTSEPGRGIWFTLVERPEEPSGVEVLSLRIGLALAEALDPFATAPIRLKWPNDVFAGDGKLAGILSEGRWRSGRLDWLAIGIGVNVQPPETAPAGTRAGALRPGVSRLDVLACIVPAVRAAAAASGPLDAGEVARFHARDLAVGRAVVSPSRGIVAGVDASGAVTVVGAAGASLHRAGSLVFEEDV
jgi:BirA family biotin operon repressor/biotin-[acetyl-CoA-carboxylase] ligase